MKYLHKKTAIIGALEKMANNLESIGQIKYAHALDVISDTLENSDAIPGGVIEEVRNKKDPQLNIMVSKMISEAHKQGITDPKKIDEFIKTQISRRALGPYSVRE